MICAAAALPRLCQESEVQPRTEAETQFFFFLKSMLFFKSKQIHGDLGRAHEVQTWKRDEIARLLSRMNYLAAKTTACDITTFLDDGANPK